MLHLYCTIAVVVRSRLLFVKVSFYIFSALLTFQLVSHNMCLCSASSTKFSDFFYELIMSAEKYILRSALNSILLMLMSFSSDGRPLKIIIYMTLFMGVNQCQMIETESKLLSLMPEDLG